MSDEEQMNVWKMETRLLKEKKAFEEKRQLAKQ